MNDATQVSFSGTFPALPPLGELTPNAAALGGNWPPSRLAILAGLRQTKYRVKSAWSGHLPFAFSIVALHRPRRLVELGTHRGASFFAFCEAMKEFEVDGHCIAIDHWLGDSQAGSMGDEVFESVDRVLRKDFEGLASTLRMSFSEAAPHFEDGSVDLLHIDGFHTYDAVTTDYATWLPKMSNRGVILFHDINEHQESFGVWRLWSELARTYPERSFAFGHSHGLGVLSLDEDSNSSVNRFLAEAASTELGAFLQQFFTTVSLSQEKARLVTSRAIENERLQATRLREAIAELERERSENAAADASEALRKSRDTEDLAYRHQADVKRLTRGPLAALNSTRGSTSWKLEAPLRWFSRFIKRRAS